MRLTSYFTFLINDEGVPIDNDLHIKMQKLSNASVESVKPNSFKSNSLDNSKQDSLKFIDRVRQNLRNITMAGGLRNVVTTMPNRGNAIVLHGEIGIGKTEFCAAAVASEGGIVLHHKKEQGINDLKQSGDVPSNLKTYEFESWEDITGVLSELAADDLNDDWGVIVIDSLTWLEHICYDHVCKQDFRGDFSSKGFYDFWAGPRAAAQRYWPKFINLLENNCQLGRRVICIAHTKTKEVKNTDGENYDQHQPEMDRDSFKLFTIWAQHVLFMHYTLEVEKEHKRAKGKVINKSRVIETEGSPTWIAKSKGLPPEISMGHSGVDAWNNYLAAVNTKNKSMTVNRSPIKKGLIKKGLIKKVAKKTS